MNAFLNLYSFPEPCFTVTEVFDDCEQRLYGLLDATLLKKRKADQTGSVQSVSWLLAYREIINYYPFTLSRFMSYKMSV